MDFEKISSNAINAIEEAFSLINQVPCGQQILRHFDDAYRNKVKIEPYPNALLKRLRLELNPAQATGACFVHDGSTGSIYYDPNTQLGILSPFMLHELVHATDPRLWKIPSLPKNSSQRTSILLETEIRAFQAQQKFIEELKGIYPSYSIFIENITQGMRILAEDLSTEEIQNLYGFTWHH